jgi:hypothetical protein
MLSGQARKDNGWASRISPASRRVVAKRGRRPKLQRCALKLKERGRRPMAAPRSPFAVRKGGGVSLTDWSGPVLDRTRGMA